MSPRLSVTLLATQSDKRLLELVSRGHERAFEAFVHRYRRPLLAYCGRLGLADGRAEDVVQQALLKAWLALREGTVVNEPRPWLYRITHNTAVNSMRTRPEAPMATLEPAQLVAVGAESEPERRIAARAALAEVAALPDMQRNVIVMSAIGGRSHEEVADALGISSGAVRGLLYRARAAMRNAAAALTPQPLIAWAAGGGGSASTTAGRLVEISAAGGGDAGAALVKAAAVGVTAALAAGAVLVPARPSHHAPRTHASEAAALAHAVPDRAGARGVLGSAGTLRVLAPAPSAAALGRLRGGGAGSRSHRVNGSRHSDGANGSREGGGRHDGSGGSREETAGRPLGRDSHGGSGAAGTGDTTQSRDGSADATSADTRDGSGSSGPGNGSPSRGEPLGGGLAGGDGGGGSGGSSDGSGGGGDPSGGSSTSASGSGAAGGGGAGLTTGQLSP